MKKCKALSAAWQAVCSRRHVHGKKENRNFTNRCADAGCFVKSLLVSYLMAGALLLLLALLLYRMQLSAQAVSIGILVIYAVTAGLSGWLAGKGMQDRRFLWGLLTGSLYFCVLAALTLIVNHGLQDVGNHFFTTLMICSGAGMLGGMLS